MLYITCRVTYDIFRSLNLHSIGIYIAMHGPMAQMYVCQMKSITMVFHLCHMKQESSCCALIRFAEKKLFFLSARLSIFHTAPLECRFYELFTSFDVCWWIYTISAPYFQTNFSLICQPFVLTFMAWSIVWPYFDKMLYDLLSDLLLDLAFNHGAWNMNIWLHSQRLQSTIEIQINHQELWLF